jgi:hypothetical protein
VLRETHETHVLSLHCSTQQLDIYPTYVVIDNLDNPDDLKTVRPGPEPEPQPQPEPQP